MILSHFRAASPVLLAVLACLATLAAQSNATSDVNPCHPRKGALGRGVTCEKVVMPNWLCSACTLRPFRSNGHFEDCANIYDLDSSSCQNQLKQYARKNKDCDPVRYKQVQDFNNTANRMGLDYFVYSICEQCCDCVPFGAKRSQYKARLESNTLLNAARGNCPAHAFYDICKVWPKVRYVSSISDSDNPKWMKTICPELTKWIKRPENVKWLPQSDVVIAPPIKNFFRRFFRVAKCGKRNIWKRCVDLEGAQKRLGKN